MLKLVKINRANVRKFQNSGATTFIFFGENIVKEIIWRISGIDESANSLWTHMSHYQPSFRHGTNPKIERQPPIRKRKLTNEPKA